MMKISSLLNEKKFQSQVVRIAKVFGWLCYHTYDSRRSEPGFPDLSAWSAIKWLCSVNSRQIRVG